MSGGLYNQLIARDISRRFLNVQALDHAQLTLRSGEIHLLMGQNGAGKSTLIKVLTGACRADSGQIELGDSLIEPSSPLHAQTLGISTVYQEVNLCPNLSIAENISAGRYPRHSWRRGGGIDWAATRERACRLMRRLDLDVPVTEPLSHFPIAIRQMTAIARALSVSASVLILDEPTSSLDAAEVNRLFEVLRQLRGQGMAILLVTHFLDQAYAIADRFTVLRNGSFVGEWPANELTRDALIRAMIGRAVTESAAMPPAVAAMKSSLPTLDAHNIGRTSRIAPLDIQFHPGEIVGIAGLLGSGRTELASVLFGLEPADSGEIRMDGVKAAINGPAEAIALGIVMCPEERKADGVITEMSIRENIILSLQARRGVLRYVTDAEQSAIAQRFIESLGIKASSIDTLVGDLSGGNQQKVLLARALAIAPRLLILDEPTRGIDVLAKQEIMQLVGELAAEGMAVMFISSEFEEVVRVAHRLVVLCDRRKIGELPGGQDESSVYALIANA